MFRQGTLQQMHLGSHLLQGIVALKTTRHQNTHNTFTIDSRDAAHCDWRRALVRESLAMYARGY